MSGRSRRATIYLDPDLHRALKLKAVQMDRSVSELVSEAVRESLTEDAEDLAAFDTRSSEPDLDFETVVRDLKERGKI
ncbi:MAG: CopG family transcriptional regulator [bacterium]|nr:ribbon-helix-helix domain-containing protein [bacterium]MDT8367443.1 CopG family transcriptional regulator [bacterium]